MSLDRSLKSVREQRHLSLGDVALNVHISPERLAAFEDGRRTPSFIQVNKLANLYGVPLYWLYERGSPNLPELIPDFRTVTPGPAHVQANSIRSLWSAEQVSKFSARLEGEVGSLEADWMGQVPKGPPNSVTAQKLRSYFDGWRQKREDALEFAGEADQRFLQAFRLFLEVQGTTVNINAAADCDFFGFYIHPAEGLPLIFVNRVISSKKAQLFTLLHEVAHRLLEADGISNPFAAQNDVERKCNGFAADFLAPMEAFRSLVERQASSTRGDVFALVNAVSRNSLLSRHATAIRLLEGGYIRNNQLNTWIAAARQFPKAEKEEESEASGGGAVHAKRIGELGYLPVYLAAEAIRKNYIDSVDVQVGIRLSESLQERAFDLARRRVKVALAS